MIHLPDAHSLSFRFVFCFVAFEKTVSIKSDVCRMVVILNLFVDVPFLKFTSAHIKS